ncbi:MAG: hypothetical protein HY775_00555 [Acidobacteria bacterium]|nr:hypothetical protein [Acidobacteriota bacterium]
MMATRMPSGNRFRVWVDGPSGKAELGLDKRGAPILRVHVSWVENGDRRGKTFATDPEEWEYPFASMPVLVQGDAIIDIPSSFDRAWTVVEFSQVSVPVYDHCTPIGNPPIAEECIRPGGYYNSLKSVGVAADTLDGVPEPIQLDGSPTGGRPDCLPV